ncbi:MAG TPA: hypothetical protein VF590_07535 [Isosphaeraceae bacterium]|jgi:hypothetical protein
MIDEDLFARIDPVLRTLGSVPDVGEEFREPPLDILRYYRRPVRLSWLPVLGRASSVVAVVRQPRDVGFSSDGYRRLLNRLALAASGRYPPWGTGGSVLVLTVIVLTPEPIAPDDDATMRGILGGPARTRTRAVPLALIRLNLGQEAMAYALATGPEGLFPEPEALADALTPHFRRFVPVLPP